jgi:uroporphyrinogen III methyltransferase/synthase
MLQSHQLDILTFTSSSTVRNFVTWLKNCAPDDGASLLDVVNKSVRLASIGPITSQTARELGLHIDIEATEFTIEGLVNALVLYEENYGRSNKYISFE